MILVKSLIVILLTLILAQFAKPFLTLMAKLFDGREGFAVEEELEETDKAAEEELEEGFYSPEKVSKEANFVAELQDKMNELNQLSEKAKEINNQLIF
jgi:hypothetical protein